ncbi:transcriptional repressor [Thalassospira sp. MA62]|nr:transcriptional repressor [Thalassospira sp. MA62]
MSDLFPKKGHDHNRCVNSAILQAEKICESQNARFTDMRRKVFSLIWDSHKAVTAYELLDALSAEGQRVQPPTIYRALEFLTDLGLVHRVESLNAYFGCDRPDCDHLGQYFICTNCGRVAEAVNAEMSNAVYMAAESVGFTIQATTVEIKGLCHDCRPH